MTAPVITGSGVYQMSNDDYHSITTPFALGSSGAIELVDECPAYFWWRQAGLNPDYEPKDAGKFDVGTCAHLMMLEPDLFDGQTVIIEADDYRGKDAKIIRDAARESGKTPLLGKHHLMIKGMRDVLFAHPIAGKAFRNYIAEESLFWKENGIWCKCRPDLHAPDWSVIVDYKTVSTANPRDLETQAARMGWFAQAAWYLDGVFGTVDRKPRDFIFVAQDREPPYLVTVNRLDPQAIDWGKAYKETALKIFSRCMVTGDWPGYRNPETPDKDTAFLLSLPAYAQYKFADRQERGGLVKPTRQEIEFSDRAQRPFEGG